jgi:N-acetylmuramoyl-L-alanine amidase CwlA
MNKTIALTKYLMKKFNIPKDRVVRHYDISGKLCPGVVGWNKDAMYDNNGKKINKTNDDTEWIKFKNRL